jgi:hypothetical protein
VRRERDVPEYERQRILAVSNRDLSLTLDSNVLLPVCWMTGNTSRSVGRGVWATLDAWIDLVVMDLTRGCGQRPDDRVFLGPWRGG